nr:hypothetical protein [Streptomyces capitiformicae]
MQGGAPSHTEKSKANEWNSVHTSFGPKSYTSWLATRRLSRLPCETCTPFGRPVVPDVKMMYARVSRPTAADVKSSAAGSGSSTYTTGTPSGTRPASDLDVIIAAGSASSTIDSRRAAGVSGSSGTYDEPVRTTASAAATIHTERSSSTATGRAGSAPTECSATARPPAISCNWR